MCARTRPPRSRFSALLVTVVVACLMVVWPVSQPVSAADARLEEAQRHRADMQAQLDDVLQRIDALEARASETRARLDQLRDQEGRERARADRSSRLVAARVRESYMRGRVDPMIELLSLDSAEEALDQTWALSLLAEHSQGELEGATAARVRTRAIAGEVTELAAHLGEQQQELEEAREEAAALVAEAEQDEREVKETIAAEEAARERAAQERAAQARADRASRQRTSRSAEPSGGSGGDSSGSVSGGFACPVGQPRSFTDTYGAPRSGGRSHKGVDILAPRGTAIYAYESGTITRMNSNSVGGISLFLKGDSGNQYYYTHLQGYVGGLSAGQRVKAGQQIAYNGDTGNAAGIPHLHWEVMPGGGGGVNPYPYAKRACG